MWLVLGEAGGATKGGCLTMKRVWAEQVEQDLALALVPVSGEAIVCG